MTIKENEKENRARPRARRDNVDLRKKVLKDQTSKILNQSPCSRNSSEKVAVKPKILVRSASSPAENKTQERLVKIGCEEKTLQIRKRLEKVIHKKKDEKIAIDLLTMLQQMKFTSQLVESTKICYTLEALKLVVKDQQIVRKTEETLIKIKSTDERKKKSENPPLPKPEAANYKEWRDTKAREKQKEIEELEKEKEKKKMEFEKKRLENERRLKELKEKEDKLEMKAKVLERRKEQLLNQVQHQDDEDKPNEDESGMRIGYWMDKLLEQVDSLNLIDKKLGNIQQSVKDIPPAEQVPDKKKEDEKTTTKPTETSVKHKKEKEHVSDKTEKKSTAPKNMFDDELLKITQQVQCINITENSIETVCVQEDRTKVVRVESDQPVIVPVLKKKVSSKSIKNVKESSFIPDKSHTEQVNEIRIAIEKEEDHAKTITSLRWLQSASMTLQILQETKIGVVVNGLRKNSGNSEVQEICKSLVLSWKKLTSNGGGGSSSAKDESKKENKPEDPVKEVRDYCRKKLLSALINRENVSDSFKLKAEKVSKEIEREIFKMFNEPSSKYRNQINSRYFNIRGNRAIQDNILEGKLRASDVAKMSHEEMASDKIKEDREKWTKESLRSVEEKHVTDEFCTCRICLPPWIHK